METVEIPKYIPAGEWMIIVFLVLLFMIAWVKNNYPRRFQRLFRSVFNKQSLFQVMSEEMIFSHRGSVVLSFVFIGSAAMMLTLATEVFDLKFMAGGDRFWLQFVYWMLFIAGVYFVKWVVSGTFLNLIGQPELFRIHMFLVSVFNKSTGIILLITAILAAYMPYNISETILKTGLFLWLALLLFRLIREVSISTALKIPWFYIILYLCAFEISPFLIGVKLVKDFNF